MKPRRLSPTDWPYEIKRATIYAIKWIANPKFRQQETKTRAAFNNFKQQSEVARRTMPIYPPSKRTFLVVASNFIETAKVELAFIEALRTAGFTPIVLTWKFNEWIKRYFALWNVDDMIFWEDFLPKRAKFDGISELKSFEDVLSLRVGGTQTGKYVASWLMRLLRAGSFDPRDKKIWQRLVREIEQGARYAEASTRLLQSVSPNVALFLERGYTPWGQLFDLCLKDNIDVIQWSGSYKNNAITLKRYHTGNQQFHPQSLSEGSWRVAKEMAWDENKAACVQDVLYKSYESGEWFSAVGTQLNKKIESRADIQRQLELNPEKKTAVIFPHLFWDATFFFGHDLFKDYEDWFVQTVLAAVNNTNLNWIIKVHPANVAKRYRDGFNGEYSEIIAIRTNVGPLPDHIKIIDAESKINTFSLFALMDYCLTVRGTIGIEASSFGIPTLTAGTGRYDHLGFTIDSEASEDYLAKLAHLQDIRPLSAQQRELAQRFAYAILLMRPFTLESLRFEYQKNLAASLQVSFEAGTITQLVNSPDMRNFIEWAAHSSAEDWLWSP